MNQKNAKQNLEILRKIFYTKNIYFRLGYGTLLGAIREKQFINGDKDIDLVFEKKDYFKIKQLIGELESNVFKIELNKQNYILVRRKEIQIDFYFFSQQNIIDKILKRVTCSFGLWCIQIPLKYFYYQEIIFKNKKYFCLPTEWIYYNYGVWWIKKDIRGKNSRTKTTKK